MSLSSKKQTREEQRRIVAQGIARGLLNFRLIRPGVMVVEGREVSIEIESGQALVTLTPSTRRRRPRSLA